MGDVFLLGLLIGFTAAVTYTIGRRHGRDEPLPHRASRQLDLERIQAARWKERALAHETDGPSYLVRLDPAWRPGR